MHHRVWLLLAATACGPPCTNHALQSVPSPGDELRGVLFRRDCGAGAIPQTHVSIVPRGAADPGGEGNVLVLEPVPGSRAAESSGASGVRLEWLGSNRLRVSYPGGFRQVRSHRMVAAVRIEFVPLVGDGATAYVDIPALPRGRS